MAYIPKKGVKRKHLEEEADDISRSDQRQHIIDMSMGKLRPVPFKPRNVDPCLRRSVLILNTLKQIEAELHNEGVEMHQSAHAARNEISEMSTSQLTLDPLPDMSTFIYPLPASSPVPMSVDAAPVEGRDFVAPDNTVVDLMPAKPLVTCSEHMAPRVTSSLYYGAPSQSSAASSSSVYYGPVGPDSGAASFSMYSEASTVSSLSPSAFYDSSISVNSVMELLKLFGDGDANSSCSVAKGPYTNYFVDENPFESLSITEADFSVTDPLTPSLGVQLSSDSPATAFLPSAMAAMWSHGNTFACNTSPSTASSPTTRPCTGMEEIAHYLQEASDSSSLPSPPRSPQTAVVANAQCSTYCRSDSTLDDLDSIMQILVGM